MNKHFGKINLILNNKKYWLEHYYFFYTYLNRIVVLLTQING